MASVRSLLLDIVRVIYSRTLTDPIKNSNGSCRTSLKAQAQAHVCPQSTFTFQEPRDRPEAQDIIISTTNTLETECALEILSLFTLSISMCLVSVDNEELGVVGGVLYPSTVKGLAEQVVEAGLATKKSIALMYIVPALAKFGLLPEGKWRF